MSLKQLSTANISQACLAMKTLLAGLEKIVHENGGGYTLLPKNHPVLIGHGESTLVLELGGGIVGKIIFYEEAKEHPDDYCPIGISLEGSPNMIKKTIGALGEMGFSNVLDHVEINRYPNGRSGCMSAGEPAVVTESGERAIFPIFYYLSPDLRENGKYEVYSIEKFPFMEVKNGLELKKQMDDSLAKIKSEVNSGKYTFYVDHHGTRDKPDKALRKMLIGRVDQQNYGELYFADLDHCIIYRREES